MNTQVSFGETVKALREARQLPLREVATALGIDTSMLGKIEKGNRRPTKDLIGKFAAFFEVSNRGLTVAFLSDVVVYQIKDSEDFASEILKVAEQKVAYLKKEKNRRV